MSMDDESIGVSFEDYFKFFAEDQWRKDHAMRHCGGIGCMLAQEENLQYVGHQAEKPLEKNELVISMRNDCREEFCCRDERHCTEYTSGQITSQHRYSYGSFTFSVQIAEESNDHMWTCFDNFDYINSADTINQRDFPLSLLTDEVVEYCKEICLVEYEDCVGFWYQRHPTVHVCSWQRTYGAPEKHQKKGGLVCRLKRAMKALKKPKPGASSGNGEPGPSETQTGVDIDQHPHDTTFPQHTTPEISDTTLDIEDDDFETVPELEMDTMSSTDSAEITIANEHQAPLSDAGISGAEDDEPPPLETIPQDEITVEGAFCERGNASAVWYRVVKKTRIRAKESLNSTELTLLEVGTLVRVLHISGRRAQINWPIPGWISLCTENGEQIVVQTDPKQVDDGTGESKPSLILHPKINTTPKVNIGTWGPKTDTTAEAESPSNPWALESASTDTTDGAQSSSDGWELENSKIDTTDGGYSLVDEWVKEYDVETSAVMDPQTMYTSTQPSFPPSNRGLDHASSPTHNGIMPDSEIEVVPELETDITLTTAEPAQDVDNDASNREWTLGWYRVLLRTRARKSESSNSSHVILLTAGTFVRVVQIRGRRALIDWPVKGWVSLYTADGEIIMVESDIPNVVDSKASSSQDTTAETHNMISNQESIPSESKKEREEHISTTSQPETTEEASFYNGFGDESTTPVPFHRQKSGAKLCIALTGMAAAAVRIMTCFPSWNSRQVGIEVKQGKHVFQRIVDLPFDVAKEIGQLTIDWLPDRLVWKANSKMITEVHEDSASIPKKPLHIRVFVAPFKPIGQASTRFVQHSMHMFKAGYKKLKTNPEKTELFVITQKSSHLWLFVCGMGLVILCLGIVIRMQKTKHFSSVYETPLLLQDFSEEKCYVLIPKDKE